MLRIQRLRTAVLPEVTSNCSEHLSADLLWAAVKKGQSLDDRFLEHARECRDCRQFVSEFSNGARASGFSFPELLGRLEAESN